MNKIKELPYIINGQKSWLHCLEINLENEPEDNLYHYHNYIEILYSKSTDDYIYIDEKYYKFSDGDLAIINPDVPHKVFHKGHSNYICIKFFPDILYADERSLFEFRYILPFVSKNSQSRIYSDDEIKKTTIPSTIENIINEWKDKKPGFELIARGGILKLFGELIRCFEYKNNNTEYPELIKNAITYIAENYASANEKEAALKCAVSYSYFSRTFKKAMNKTFNGYLTAVRLKEAEKLLITTEKTITEIAFETGFSTASHFISLFKKHKNISPKQYRINLKNSGCL